MCTDLSDRVLMVTQKVDAKRLGLRCRMVCLIVHDEQKRLYLHRQARQAELFPGRWHFSSAGLVRLGEGRKDTALRLATGRLGVFGGRVSAFANSSFIPGCERYHVTLFHAGPALCTLPEVLPLDRADDLFVTRDELLELMKHTPGMFSPALHWAVQQPLFFAFQGST